MVTNSAQTTPTRSALIFAWGDPVYMQFIHIAHTSYCIMLQLYTTNHSKSGKHMHSRRMAVYLRSELALCTHVHVPTISYDAVCTAFSIPACMLSVVHVVMSCTCTISEFSLMQWVELVTTSKLLCSTYSKITGNCSQKALKFKHPGENTAIYEQLPISCKLYRQDSQWQCYFSTTVHPCISKPLLSEYSVKVADYVMFT